MSAVFWCDYGNHAAKLTEDIVLIGKPAKNVTITDQFGSHVGQVPAEQQQVCNECAVLMGFSNDIEPIEPAKRHAAIEAKVKGK